MPYIENDSRLWAEVSSISRDEGFRLYDLEKMGRKKLNVTVAAPGKVKEGISIDGCARVCKRLQLVIAAEGPSFGLTEDTELNVSSPGVNRSLRVEDHFLESVGERVLVKFSGQDGEKVALTGKVVSFENRMLKLEPEVEGKVQDIAFEQIAEARVDFPF